MKKVYSIYDKKAMFYGPLMVYDNAVSAMRDFEQVCMNSNSLPNKYPGDFALYYLGAFDVEKGKVDCVDVPQHVADATEFFVSTEK